MKKMITMVLMVAIAAAAQAQTQNVVFPHQQEMKSGNWEGVVNLIDDEVAAHADEVEWQYAKGQFFGAKNNPYVDLYEAYLAFHAADSLYRKMDKPTRKKLAAKGFSKNIIINALTKVCQQALQEADRSYVVPATPQLREMVYWNYLVKYEHAPNALRQLAEMKRKAAIREMEK